MICFGTGFVTREDCVRLFTFYYNIICLAANVGTSAYAKHWLYVSMCVCVCVHAFITYLRLTTGWGRRHQLSTSLLNCHWVLPSSSGHVCVPWNCKLHQQKLYGLCFLSHCKCFSHKFQWPLPIKPVCEPYPIEKYCIYYIERHTCV